MRPQSDTMLVALAISFATALSLAVALICISYLRGEALPLPDAVDTAEGGETTVAEEPTETDTSAETDELPVFSNGLRFSASGDGTCRLVSIGNCADACVVIPEFSPVGDRVVEIAPRAFYGSVTVTAIQIPSSVRLIGELAFADCPNLIYISVSPQNAYYRDIDGVLYSADERELLLYPPRRAGSTLTIRAVTVEIADMAFYHCAYLEHIVFTGTAAEWETIRIGTKNYSLTAAAKRFEG